MRVENESFFKNVNTAGENDKKDILLQTTVSGKENSTRKYGRNKILIRKNLK